MSMTAFLKVNKVMIQDVYQVKKKAQMIRFMIPSSIKLLISFLFTRL